MKLCSLALLLASCCVAQFLTGKGPVPIWEPGIGDPWHVLFMCIIKIYITIHPSVYLVSRHFVLSIIPWFVGYFVHGKGSWSFVLPKMSKRHLIHNLRSLRYGPIQNTHNRIWFMPNGIGEDQISRTFWLEPNVLWHFWTGPNRLHGS